VSWNIPCYTEVLLSKCNKSEAALFVNMRIEESCAAQFKKQNSKRSNTISLEMAY